jgi:hypothetical protein
MNNWVCFDLKQFKLGPRNIVDLHNIDVDALLNNFCVDFAEKIRDIEFI